MHPWICLIRPVLLINAVNYGVIVSVFTRTNKTTVISLFAIECSYWFWYKRMQTKNTVSYCCMVIGRRSKLVVHMFKQTSIVYSGCAGA